MHSTLVGRIHELKAQIWLLEQGYQVFQNVSPAGPADLIIWDHKTNTFTAIDVKTVTVYVKADGTKRYDSSLNINNSRKDNVTYLGYCKEEDSFMWL